MRKTPIQKDFSKEKRAKMTNAHGTSFFLYKKLNKCRIPSQEISCRRKVTTFKKKKIRNTIFLEIISTVVESAYKAISTKERRQMTKAPIQKDFSKEKMAKMTNANGTSFSLYKKLNKCQIPSQELFCRRKETTFKKQQIRNTLFLEIISTVVESPCKAISTKEGRPMTKTPIQKDFSKQKTAKMTNANGTSFSLYKKLNKCRIPSQEIFCRRKETPFKIKQIRKTLFLCVISTVVEYTCKEISKKKKTPNDKKSNQKKLFKRKKDKDHKCERK